MVHHILVPVDNSDESTKALEYAVEEYPDERITALHVVQFDRTSLYGDEGFLYSDEYREQVRKRVRTSSRERARPPLNRVCRHRHCARNGEASAHDYRIYCGA